MNNTTRIKEAISRFITVADLGNLAISEQDIEFYFSPAPHKPPSKLPSGKFAVYVFFYMEKCLKVGKAGTNSQARYSSQHYGFSAPSTLAKCIFSDQKEFGLNNLQKEQTGSWIKENLSRLNILLPEKIGIEGLNLLEAFLQCYFKPKYEGFKTQRKTSVNPVSSVVKNHTTEITKDTEITQRKNKTQRGRNKTE